MTSGYRNLLNRTFCNDVAGRASGLQTHSQHDLFTWYNQRRIKVGRGL